MRFVTFAVAAATAASAATIPKKACSAKHHYSSSAIILSSSIVAAVSEVSPSAYSSSAAESTVAATSAVTSAVSSSSVASVPVASTSASSIVSVVSSSTAAAVSSSTAAAASTSAAASSSAAAPAASGAFEFWGINESGAEFASTTLPGIDNTDYTWYDLDTIDTFISQGMNIFRVNFLMERLVPSSLTGSLDAAYAGNLSATVSHITSKGAYAMICPHNYGRYNGDIITDTAGFKAFWTTIATPYKSNDMVIFDTNNEYHDMDESLVVSLNQAAIDGIRAAGATTQIITPEGNAYTGAWSWISSGNGASMGTLTDPSNKLIYQMHQYLDSDYSGTSETCQSATIMSDSLKAATKWLRTNKKTAIIGEFAGGVNSVCESAIKDGLSYLQANSDVWKGAMWWAAGPFWGTYMYSAEPTSGVAYSLVQSLSTTYAPK